MESPSVVDAHVHFWDPTDLQYPWLRSVPALDRAHLPPAYARAIGSAPVDRVVVVAGNCRPEQALREVEFVEHVATGAEPRVAGIVAFADLTRPETFDAALDALSSAPLVKGIRQNIQGEPSGFALQAAFVQGVQTVGRRGFTFDLCVTHDQLPEVTELVRRCPEVRFVLDHGGKPPIRDRRLEPWASNLARLATHSNVYCKLSGLLTEADVRHWRDDDLIPYATHVCECFGAERVMYGSDWPVLTLAGDYQDWYGLTKRFTAGWSAAEQQRFYRDNAVHVYGLS